MNILVVDDDPGMRDMASAALRTGGYEVDAVASGDAALQKLGDPIDVVLTDLDMPGSVNGVELTRIVRRQTSMDVIIMTGFPDLSTAIHAVREGAYDYLVKPFSGDALRMSMDRCAAKRRLSKELERERALREELNRAYGELSRMQKVRDLFGQFTTPEVARFVLDNPDDFWKRGERRDVTVMFADVRRFTPYTAKVSPEEALQTLNNLFDVVVGAVREEGGVVNKFLGDGVMAIFGAPQSREDHAEAAARAAHKARALLGFLSTPGGPEEELAVGFALNTGEVIAGCMGTKDRTEYGVIGSAVNLAARIEKVAGPGEILLGPETARRAGALFDLERRPPTVLPGFLEPVELSALVAPRAGAFASVR